MKYLIEFRAPSPPGVTFRGCAFRTDATRTPQLNVGAGGDADGGDGDGGGNGSKSVPRDEQTRLFFSHTFVITTTRTAPPPHS